MARYEYDADDVFIPPAGSIKDAAMSSTSPAGVTKTRHISVFGTAFDLVIGGTPADAEYIVWVATSAGTFKAFQAVLNDTGTTSDIDFDCKLNGTTILSAAINFTHADTDKVAKSGTLSTTTFATGDVISIECDQTTTTGAQGPYAQVVVDHIST